MKDEWVSQDSSLRTEITMFPHDRVKSEHAGPSMNKNNDNKIVQRRTMRMNCPLRETEYKNQHAYADISPEKEHKSHPGPGLAPPTWQ